MIFAALCFVEFETGPPSLAARAMARSWVLDPKVEDLAIAPEGGDGGPVSTNDGGNEKIMWVYILKSLVVREKFYVGLTDEPERRLSEHNAGESFSTKDDRPWKIFAKFWFESTDTAECFERYLKSGSGCAFAARHFS